MATKGKEKRGTSPSKSNHIDSTQRKRTPKTSLPNSPDKDHTNPSQKQVPHYLRPTISSRNDQPAASKQAMRTTQKPSLNRRASFDKNFGPDNITTQKPSLNRRASFDKPPSSYSIKKALQSPTTNTNSTSRERTNNVRAKPISMSERMTSKTVTHKAVKSQPNSLSRPKSIKKSTSSAAGAVKKETKAPSSSSSSPDVIQTLNNIESAEPEDKESLIVNEVEDELLKVDGEVEFPPEISIPENNKEFDDVANYHHSTDIISPKSPEVIEKLKSCDTTSTVSEDQNAPLVADDEVVEEENEDKIEGEILIIIDNHHVEEEEKENKDESDDSHPSEEGMAAEPKIETEVNEGEEGAIKKEEVEDGTKEREEVDNHVVKEAKPEMVNVVVKRQGGGGGGQGKKDSPAYNDVIEETASKLLEQRKNKVSALVGAFETVISLQEPETPS